MTLKQLTGKTALVALAALAFAGSAKAALVNDSIYIGFRVQGASGTDKELVVNLGAVGSLATSGIITNINADLVAAFGAGWNTRSDVVLGVIGKDGTTTSRDVYAGSFGGAYSAINGAYSTPQLAGLISNINNVTLGSAGSNPLVSIQQWDASNNTWSKLEPASPNSAFGDAKNYITYGLFEADANFSVSTTKSFVIWDYNAAGTDFTRATSSTYYIDSAGNIGVVSAVPEPSTYGLLGAGAFAAAAMVRRRKLSAAKAA